MPDACRCGSGMRMYVGLWYDCVEGRWIPKIYMQWSPVKGNPRVHAIIRGPAPKGYIMYTVTKSTIWSDTHRSTCSRLASICSSKAGGSSGLGIALRVQCHRGTGQGRLRHTLMQICKGCGSGEFYGSGSSSSSSSSNSSSGDTVRPTLGASLGVRLTGYSYKK